MPKIWSWQAYVWEFDCSSIANKTVTIFECIKIAEYIYEGVVEPSYKNLLRKMSTVLISARKWEEIQPVNYLPCDEWKEYQAQKRYVDHSKDISKLTYLFSGPEYSSDKYKVLKYFGSKYDISGLLRTTGRKLIIGFFLEYNNTTML